MTFSFSQLTVPSPPPNASISAVLSRDAKYLFTTSVTSGAQRAYKRDGDTVTRLTSPFVGTAPANNTRATNFSRENKFVAFQAVDAAGLRVYRNNNDDTFTNITANLDYTAPAGRACVFSDTENALTVSLDSSPYLAAFKYDPTTEVFNRITLTFSSAIPSRTYECCVSPDGQWMAVTYVSSPFVRIYRITRTSDLAWTLTLATITVGTIGSVIPYTMDWHPSSRFFTWGQDGDATTSTHVSALQPDGTWADMGALPSAPALRGKSRFSPDGRYLFLTTNSSASRVVYWHFDAEAGLFTYLGSMTPAPNTYGISGMSISDDMLHFAITGSASPYIALQRMGASSVRAGFGSLTAEATGGPGLLVDRPTKTRAVFGSLSGEVLAINGEVDRWEETVTPALAQVALDALPPRVGAAIQQDAYIEAGFNSLSSDGVVRLIHHTEVAAGFGSLSAAILSGPLRATMVSSFGSLTSAVLSGPLRTSVEAGFGAMTTLIEVAKPNLLGIIESSFGALSADVSTNNPYPIWVTSGFGSLTTEAVGSSPVSAAVTASFGALTSEGYVAVPMVARITANFGSLGAEAEAVIPLIARVETSFGALTSEGEADVPLVTYLTTDFGALQAEPLVMVPYAPAIAASFGALAMDATSLTVVYTDTRGVFGSLGAEIIVARPVKATGEIILPGLTTDGFIIQTNTLAGAAVLPFVEVTGEAELFNGVRGELTLPFLSVDGSARLDYLVNGGVVLPSLTASGEIQQDNFIRGDVALPFVEVSGYINGEKRETDVGKTPSLIAPGDSLRLGGGIFLNFNTITIG